MKRVLILPITFALTLALSGAASADTIWSGRIGPGEVIVNGDGKHVAHQDDGNVVLYGSGPLWATGTHGQSTDALVMQDDGNLVVYNEGRRVWDSGTHGNPGAVLRIQDDGNLVVVAPGNRPIWSSKPSPRPARTSAPVQRQTAPRAAGNSVWDRIAQCESGGNWQINTGNGYYGGLQFALASWRGVGGQGYPHQASRAEQIRRAEMLLARQGWGAWPACSRRLGLR